VDQRIWANGFCVAGSGYWRREATVGANTADDEASAMWIRRKSPVEVTKIALASRCCQSNTLRYHATR